MSGWGEGSFSEPLLIDYADGDASLLCWVGLE